MRSSAEPAETPALTAVKQPTVRYRFRITVEGLVLLIVIILVGFAAWHSGTNLLYLIFAILISFYLLHGSMLWLNLSRLTFLTSTPENAVTGHPFDIEITVANRKRLLSSFGITLCHLTLNHPGQKKGTRLSTLYIPIIPANSHEKIYHTITLPRRGLCTISQVSASTNYPFGFEERTSLRSTENSILVLPATFNVRDLLSNHLYGLGDQESSQRGPGTDIFGLREYAPGDHARSIHWKTTARARKIIVSEYARDERKQVLLILNNSVPEPDRLFATPLFENAITLTASLARHLINAGFEVGLVTADNQTPVAQGPMQLFFILRHLALADMVTETPLDLTDSSLVYIEFLPNRESGIPPDATLIDSRTWKPGSNLEAAGEKFL